MAETEEMSGKAFAAKYGVELTYESHGAQRDDDGWEHNAYTVHLNYYPAEKPHLRRVTIPWKQGYGVEGSPEAGTVLENVASDARGADADFEEWASDYGLDSDSRKAYATYLAVRKIAADLYAWCRSEAMWDDLRAVQES